jgi:membrane protease YdiL (CAAX protease family)
MEGAMAVMPSTSLSRDLKDLLRNQPLVSYFVLAYAGSWIVSIPAILAYWGYLPGAWTAAFYLGPFAGPFVAAFVMTGISEGRPGVHRFLRRFLIWRVGWPWYAFILLGIPALMLAGLLVLPGVAPSFQGLTPQFVLNYPLSFLVIFLLGGPLGEEPGWRGFALPRLQPRFGPMGGTLLLGILWAGWHLPAFLTPAQHGGPGTDWAAFFTNFPIFVASTTAMTVVFTWVFNHTRASIFIAILLHASVDSTGGLVNLFSAPLVQNHDPEVLLAFGSLALVLIVATRGRLGYHDGQERSWGTLPEPAPALARS